MADKESVPLLAGPALAMATHPASQIFAFYMVCDAVWASMNTALVVTYVATPYKLHAMYDEYSNLLAIADDATRQIHERGYSPKDNVWQNVSRGLNPVKAFQELSLPVGAVCASTLRGVPHFLASKVVIPTAELELPAKEPEDIVQRKEVYLKFFQDACAAFGLEYVRFEVQGWRYLCDKLTETLAAALNLPFFLQRSAVLAYQDLTTERAIILILFAILAGITHRTWRPILGQLCALIEWVAQAPFVYGHRTVRAAWKYLGALGSRFARNAQSELPVTVSKAPQNFSAKTIRKSIDVIEIDGVPYEEHWELSPDGSMVKKIVKFSKERMLKEASLQFMRCPVYGDRPTGELVMVYEFPGGESGILGVASRASGDWSPHGHSGDHLLSTFHQWRSIDGANQSVQSVYAAGGKVWLYGPHRKNAAVNQKGYYEQLRLEIADAVVGGLSAIYDEDGEMKFGTAKFIKDHWFDESLAYTCDMCLVHLKADAWSLLGVPKPSHKEARVAMQVQCYEYEMPDPNAPEDDAKRAILQCHYLSAGSRTTGTEVLDEAASRGLMSHQLQTKPGMSGTPVYSNQAMVAMHIAGKYGVTNIAISMQAIRDFADVVFDPIYEAGLGRETAAQAATTMPYKKGAFRMGFVHSAEAEDQHVRYKLAEMSIKDKYSGDTHDAPTEMTGREEAHLRAQFRSRTSVRETPVITLPHEKFGRPLPLPSREAAVPSSPPVLETDEVMASALGSKPTALQSAKKFPANQRQSLIKRHGPPVNMLYWERAEGSPSWVHMSQRSILDKAHAIEADVGQMYDVEVNTELTTAPSPFRLHQTFDLGPGPREPQQGCIVCSCTQEDMLTQRDEDVPFRNTCRCWHLYEATGPVIPCDVRMDASYIPDELPDLKSYAATHGIDWFEPEAVHDVTTTGADDLPVHALVGNAVDPKPFYGKKMVQNEAVVEVALEAGVPLSENGNPIYVAPTRDFAGVRAALITSAAARTVLPANDIPSGIIMEHFIPWSCKTPLPAPHDPRLESVSFTTPGVSVCTDDMPRLMQLVADKLKDYPNKKASAGYYGWRLKQPTVQDVIAMAGPDLVNSHIVRVTAQRLVWLSAQLPEVLAKSSAGDLVALGLQDPILPMVKNEPLPRRKVVGPDGKKLRYPRNRKIDVCSLPDTIISMLVHGPQNKTCIAEQQTGSLAALTESHFGDMPGLGLHDEGIDRICAFVTEAKAAVEASLLAAGEDIMQREFVVRDGRHEPVAVPKVQYTSFDTSSWDATFHHRYWCLDSFRRLRLYVFACRRDHVYPDPAVARLILSLGVLAASSVHILGNEVWAASSRGGMNSGTYCTSSTNSACMGLAHMLSSGDPWLRSFRAGDDSVALCTLAQADNILHGMKGLGHIVRDFERSPTAFNFCSHRFEFAAVPPGLAHTLGNGVAVRFLNVAKMVAKTTFRSIDNISPQQMVGMLFAARLDPDTKRTVEDFVAGVLKRTVRPSAEPTSLPPEVLSQIARYSVEMGLSLFSDWETAFEAIKSFAASDEGRLCADALFAWD